MDTFTRIIGIDPGLRRTGWGVIDTLGNSVRFVASGLVTSDGDLDLAGGENADGEDYLNLRAAREAADRVAIRRAMTQSEGNISSAAKLLGISRPTLYDLLKQYRMQA